MSELPVRNLGMPMVTQVAVAGKPVRRSTISDRCGARVGRQRRDVRTGQRLEERDEIGALPVAQRESP